MVKNAIFCCVLLTSIVLFSRVMAQPSFDCSKARTADEIAICADPILSDIDVLVANAYHSYVPSYRPKREVALRLLRDRASCSDNQPCIAAVQNNSLSTYSFGRNTNSVPEPWVEIYARALMGRKAAAIAKYPLVLSRGVPQSIGKCVRTNIQKVTTRFGEPIDYSNEASGTAIAYSNGGYQVSYGRGELHNIEAGHAVIMCLMSIPRDCPQGDQRGRLFYVLDINTNSHWVLPDAQHFCGGA